MLNKALLGIGIFLFSSWSCASQPIQLIPHKEGQAPSSALPVSSQEVVGFWEGTPPSIIETYFPKIPIRLSSPLLRKMRSEVLKEKYGSFSYNSVYEKARLSLLMETGQFEVARELVLETSLPEKEAILLDLQWLSGEQKKACEKVSNLIRTSENLEWKKQNIYCLFLNGETERAKIALELLSESKPEALILLNALFAPSSKLTFEPSYTKSPFLLTVWSATAQDIPEDSLKTFSPSSLELVAKSDKLPLKTRLMAGEGALKEGTLSGETLLSLLKDTSTDTFLGKCALALNSQNSQELFLLLDTASQEKLALMGNVFKPLLVKIEPSPERLSLALYLIRAFLGVGENDSAQKWGTFLLREAPDQAIAVLPLLHLVFPSIKWSETQLQAYQSYQLRENPTSAAQNSYCVRRIFGTLGESSGTALKGEPLPPSWRQEKAFFEGDAFSLLEAAVESRRKGEIFLLILTLVGETPLKDFSCDKLSLLLNALQKSGYANEARSLALEFLLAKGL